MTLPPGTRLGTYEILAPIGSGGMGEVYRARDSKLDRDVAIKVLPQSVADDPITLARFEREAKAVAALSHPNILAIYDFGTHDGVSYAVTELLEGETLREKLVLGPLSVKQTADYATQIAKGLSAAHDRGVVHRDLKPENLFVTKDGHVKILDFGLAKRFDASSTEKTNVPTVSEQTEPGTVMGTMGYMSPEQARGLPVDHRSDIFSFGAILYELLSGKKAFKRETASDTLVAILKEEPPELSESDRTISPALDNVVRHCLEKDRNDRFQSARDVAFALSEALSPTATSAPTAAATAPPSVAPPVRMGRRVLVPAAVAALIILAGAVALLRRAPRVAAPTVKRVAVLPFENLGSPENEYFADGIGDEVRGKLTSLPGVEVIARASSTPYKKTTKSPGQIAQELGAGYLLTATVRWENSGGASRVHVTPELVEVKDSGAPTAKWQQPFDAALTDVFQVQSDIATRVARELGVALGAGEEKRLAEKPTQNLAAYEAFLKGDQAAVGSDPLSRRKALGFYEQAVALDPGFAQAWARVSAVSSFLYANSMPTPELAERARRAAEKAVALAPNRPEGYRALGGYRRLVLDDPKGALDEYERGRRFAPGNSDYLSEIALVEQARGRWDAAIEHLREAERLNPRSVGTKRILGQTLLRARRYDEARRALDGGLALAPADLALIEEKALSFLSQGNLAGARAVIAARPTDVAATDLVAYFAKYWDLVWVFDDEERELLLRLTPTAFDDDRGGWAIALAQAYAVRGDSANARVHAEEARKAAEEGLRAAPDDPDLHALHGLALAYLGRKEESIREGERAVALQPISKSALYGPYIQHQLVRIDILVGEHGKAIDNLEPLLRIPYYLSPGRLRIDPNFDPLRKNPRFRKLVAR